MLRGTKRKHPLLGAALFSSRRPPPKAASKPNLSSACRNACVSMMSGYAAPESTA
jgi:hypothetical protein